MQVYKVFFRILNKQKGQIIMYLCIFFGIATIVSAQGLKNEETAFEPSEYAFAVFDADQSAVSRGMVSYLEKENKKVDIEDDRETVQDELYNRTVNCVIRIPKGFGKSLVDGGDILPMEIASIPETVYASSFENMANQYVSLVRAYAAGGYGEAEALQKAEAANREEAEATMADGRGSSSHSIVYYYFAYVPYIFISICVVGIGPVLIVFRRKEVGERNNCSSYPLLRANVELFAGTVTTGVGLCIAFFLIVFCGVGTGLFSMQGWLHMLNVACFLVVSLGIVFFLGQVVKRTSVVSMVSNVISLGMCFLGGIFVPLEFLGEGIVRVAHFLPSYWYILAVRMIDAHVPGKPLSDLWMYLGIELLFGAAFICVGLAYSRVRTGGRIA